MILELADIRIKPGSGAAFEAASRQGLDTVLSRAAGFKSYQVRRCVESPHRYVLLIEWDTLEAHTVGFRQSPAHAEWRAMVGSFFEKPPFVEHFELAAASTQPDA
jgi:heme-degrading monooxygenase HmoA